MLADVPEPLRLTGQDLTPEDLERVARERSTKSSFRCSSASDS
jgi:hypothetical protein